MHILYIYVYYIPFLSIWTLFKSNWSFMQAKFWRLWNKTENLTKYNRLLSNFTRNSTRRNNSLSAENWGCLFFCENFNWAATISVYTAWNFIKFLFFKEKLILMIDLKFILMYIEADIFSVAREVIALWTHLAYWIDRKILFACSMVHLLMRIWLKLFWGCIF